MKKAFSSIGTIMVATNSNKFCCEYDNVMKKSIVILMFMWRVSKINHISLFTGLQRWDCIMPFPDPTRGYK